MVEARDPSVGLNAESIALDLIENGPGGYAVKA